MENRQQALYWNALVQLKVDCEYIRRYRDSLAATVTRYTIIRAVVSVSALGGRIEEDEITKRRHKLMTLRHDGDRKHLPTPLPFRPAILRLANAAADA